MLTRIIYKNFLQELELDVPLEELLMISTALSVKISSENVVLSVITLWTIFVLSG